MTLQAIRAHIESKVFNDFQAMVPPIEVMFDNVQETPPALPYVICMISYTDTTETVLCEESIENLRGNLQLSIYAPRAQGMKPLELYATQAMKAMNTLYDRSADVHVKAGQIQGPTPVLATTAPYGLITVSCPFLASVI